MSSKNQGKTEEEEGKIPVLTVLKNNAILKNIFIVNKPPEEENQSRADHEDVLLVGRHPDCDLMLTHPSISRFHLQIRSKPSSRTFSVIDLSSVHGTWVLGRKIVPMVSVEMKEGDTLRIGVSSRVYRLHWIPISRAYDLEDPFVSQLDVVVEEEDDDDEERKVKNSKCYPAENEEIESVDSVLEDLSSLFLDENVELTVKEEVSLAPGMLEDMVSLCCEEEMRSPSKEEAIGIPSDLFEKKSSYLPTISVGENKLSDSLNQVLSPPYVESVVECDETLTEKLSEAVFLPAESETVCLPDEEAVLGTKMQQFNTPLDRFTSPLPSGLENSFEHHYSSLLITNSPAPLDEKSEAESVIISRESESEYTLRDYGLVTDTDASTLPSCLENSFNNHSSGLLITNSPASLVDEKSEAEYVIIPKESESECTLRDYGWVTDTVAFNSVAGIINSENMFLQVEEAMSGTKLKQIKVVEEVVDSLSDGENQDMYRSQSQLLNDKFCHNQGYSLNELIQDIGNKHTGSISPTPHQIESVNWSIPQEAVLKITNENQILKPDMEILESCIKAMEKNSTNRNIWSRRGKDTSAPQVWTSKSTTNADTEVTLSNEKNIFPVLDGEEEEEIFTPDKENFSPNTLQLQLLKKGKLEGIKHSKSQKSRNSKGKFNPVIYPNESISPNLCKKKHRNFINKTVSKDLLSVLDGEGGEEEICTLDKQNFSPNTLQFRLLKKKGKVEEIKRTKDYFVCSMYPDENMSPTPNKENQTPEGAQVQKLQRKPFSSHVKLAQEKVVMTLKERLERVPFQSLKNSRGKRTSDTFCPASAAKSFDFSNCEELLDKHINPSDISRVQKKRWDMIVDTTSLINKESRKALQLLQGLKGTRLIIPRLVIRELESMKHQFTIFRRISEASLALEWIEECMLKTNWWVHIQSSVDEGRLIAPTPPVSPQTKFSEESWSFLGGVGSSHPHSFHENSIEIVSPTLEDHILDFALLYRRNQNDEQIVLLSEDVTLKIKCMAEGMLCEPVQEFRESLVNPFSERFLWTNSCPRGQTWSCQDDVVLREKYFRLPLRKSSKGVASGLKLILLHNYQFGALSH